MKFIFYYLFLPLVSTVALLNPLRNKYKILNWIIKLNNKIILNSKTTSIKNVLILLPRCLQYFHCNYNLIYSIDNCHSCGKCKIKDILKLKEKYGIEIKVASGGNLAKMFVKEVNPDYIIAVACRPELILGIKEVYPYKVVGIPNIIVNKPCINTDVELSEIENILKRLTS